MTTTRRPFHLAFTLVELLVAIGVVIILVGILLPAVQGAREQARKATTRSLVRDVATPLTFRDQGGRWNGAVAGWSWDFGQAVDALPRDLVETPVRGLFMAGYQAATGLYSGGVATAVESGRKAAEAVLRSLRG